MSFLSIQLLEDELFTRCSLLVTFYSLLFIRYSLLQYCIIYTMSTLNYTSVPEKENKDLMDAFLQSVDIVCYDLDLILFRLDFQIMNNEKNCGEVITEQQI